jgi:SAM-dependent methyltransferase
MRLKESRKVVDYSDGSAIEDEILSLVNRAAKLSSETAVAEERYSDSWPIKYHLCPERGNLLRHLCFEGLSVLELGAGMGGVSRFLAENAKSLTVVEGTESRFAVLKARLRDLTNWTGIVANIQDIELAQKFDVVCIIGVLEYSEIYLTPPSEFTGSPFVWLLKKASEHLKEDGVLILAIENKLGVKYWAGAAEDHTGKLFEGICGYVSERKSARTFSRGELVTMIHASGFPVIEEYFPFPDYKIPRSVIGRQLMELSPQLAASLATLDSYQNYESPRITFFPELLAVENLATSGVLPEFSNSFLFIASRNEQSVTYQQLLRRQLQGKEVAWRYANYRNTPAVTTFCAREVQSKPRITKKKNPIGSGSESAYVREEGAMRVKWQPSPESEIMEGTDNRLLLARCAYFDGATACYVHVREFIRWSFAKWAIMGAEEWIDGAALDAIITNSCKRVDSTGDKYELFDLEWQLLDPMAKSWFILRNVLHLQIDSRLLLGGRAFLTPKRLYCQLCKDLNIIPNVDGDIKREAEFQALATNRNDINCYVEKIKNEVSTRIPRGGFPRIPCREEVFMRAFLSNPFARAAIRCLDGLSRSKALLGARKRGVYAK